jgi:aspartyl-tRNA(Asn)/glutamyl-tRNA(Gln) amidotransferase subunit C
MPITRQDVEQIADLAKLHLTPENREKVQQSLSDVLQLVDRIQQADVEDVKPMRHPRDARQLLRADKVTESSRKQALLALAPETDGDYYLVPKVVEQA